MKKPILVTIGFVFLAIMALQAQELNLYFENGRWGYKDTNGSIVIPAKYDMGSFFKEDLAWVVLNNKYGFIKKNGEIAVPLNYNSVSEFSDGLSKVLLKGKWGYIDKTGNEIIPIKYDHLGDFNEGLAVAGIGKEKTRKLGFIDKTGKAVIPMKYEEAGGFKEGLAKVLLDGRYFFIDHSGNKRSSDYGYANDFSDGMARVLAGLRYGYIDKTGNEVIAAKYIEAGDFKEGKAKVSSDENTFYIDKTGKEISIVHEVLTPFKSPLLAHPGGGGISGGTWGFTDSSGKVVIYAQYEEAYPFSEGRARVRSYGMYGYIGSSGATVISAIYSGASDFSGGVAKVKYKNKYGFIDKTGKTVVPLIYDEAYDFYDGLARVKINNKYGFINKTGKEIISPLYHFATDFSEGMATVGDLYGRHIYLDSTGNGVTSFYTKAQKFKNGIAIVQLTSGSYALLDKSGKETPCSFLDDEGAYKRIVINNKTGIIDNQNKWVIPCTYDKMFAINKEGLVSAKNESESFYTYLDLATRTPYNWALGEKISIHQLASRKVVLYKHHVKNRRASFGLKTEDGKVLLYPVFDKISVQPDKIIAEISGAKISFDNSALGEYKIVFKSNDQHTCPECNGGGYVFITRKIAGSTQTETSKSYSPTWERVWDTQTNSYKEVRGTKETTTTKTNVTKGSTYDEKISCSRCSGAGNFTHMIWNLAAFSYELVTAK